MSEKLDNVEEPKKKRRWLRGCLTLIGVLFVVGIIGSLFSSGGDDEATQVATIADKANESDEAEVQADDVGLEKTVADTVIEEPTAKPTDSPQPTNTPQPTDTPQVVTSFEVGDVVSINDYVMVVLGWSKSEGNDIFKPDAGKGFVAVDVLFVNQGSSSESLSSLLQMTLKDSTGQNYKPDLIAQSALNVSSPDGELTAGERSRGTVGFQVPQEANDLQFVFDASIWGTGKIFVDLGPDPISYDPPSELDGEVTLDMYSIGETIIIGDFALTVNGVTFPEGNDFNKPDDGKRFIIVDVTFDNVSGDSTNLSSAAQMTLKDSTGQKYNVDIMASVASGGSTPDGELVAGEKLRGQVGYQVPIDSTGLVFVFDANIFGAGKVFVALE